MMQGGAFHDDASKFREVNKIGIFLAVAERPRRRHDGILQGQALEFYLCLYHNNLSILKTGPSLHTHTLPSLVFSTQQRHAPIPQAI